MSYIPAQPDYAGIIVNDSITIGATKDYNIRFGGSGSTAGTNKEYQWNVFQIAAGTSAITSSTDLNPVTITATAHGFTNG